MAEETPATVLAAPSEAAPAAAPASKPTEVAEGSPEAPPAAATEVLTTKPLALDAPTNKDAVIANADNRIIPAAAATDANGEASATPLSSKKIPKRKSIGSTPSKKLKGKKSMPDLHLNVSPGEYWYVQMKGYPPWPAIVCDEEMLPESLLSKRPVSAMRVDGTYREDFQDSGKNARDRRYPVMFLGTNEFAWQVNTDLVRLDTDEMKGIVERNEQGKKSKALWQAYQIAAEDHDLEYFKQMLKEHEMHIMQEHERALEAETKKQEKLAEKQAEKQAKKEKKEKKAKPSIDEDGDVEMGNGDEPTEKKKPAKKRKKSTGEVEEKTKIVLKGLKASGEEEQPKPKKPRKSKPAAESEEPEAKAAATPTPPETEEERLKKREKTIFYLRHKLQKGLVSREKPPQPEEMTDMDSHLTVLENYTDLEPEIIRETKVNKLLKVILKLGTIPRDVELKFRERCTKLLGIWTQNLSAADEKAKDQASNGVTNGKVEEVKKEDLVKPTTEPLVNGKPENAAAKPEPASNAGAEPAKGEVGAEAA